MKQNILLTSLVVVGFGCQMPRAETGGLEQTNPPVIVEVPEDELGAKTDKPIVGFTSLGAVVIFDGRTGEIMSAVPGGGGKPRDVAMDPWRSGVWVFEENEDATGGEIRFCPLKKEVGAPNDTVLPTLLDPCEHTAWVDGVAAIMPTDQGLWVFEDGIGGARWKVIAAENITSSASAPRPASIWMQDGEIEAFTYGFSDDRLQLFQADFTPVGPFVDQAFDWGEPLGYPPTARYAWLSRDAGLLFDAVSNTLTVRRVFNGETSLPRTVDVGMPVPRIESAIGLGESAFLLGKDALWVVTANDSQGADGASEVELVAGVWLHGDVRESSLFFSRDLLVTPDRAFVGTDRGVRAIGLEMDKNAVNNVFYDEQFVGEDLRGPLDAVRLNGS